MNHEARKGLDQSAHSGSGKEMSGGGGGGGGGGVIGAAEGMLVK